MSKKTTPKRRKYITEKFRQAHPGLMEDVGRYPDEVVAMHYGVGREAVANLRRRMARSNGAGAPTPVPTLDVANAVAYAALKTAKAPKAKAPKKAAKTAVTLLLAPEWVEYIDALAESQCRTREGQALWILIQAVTAAKGGE
jgi:hypothetical protein